jgi:RNA polymerase subunit RPABC4/transcription elongation factor Spt4
MICSACRRKVSPDRSFCPTCGSAVFIDVGDREWQRIHEIIPTATDELGSSGPTRPIRTVRPRPVQRKVTRTVTTPTPTPSVGCLGCLVRLVIFAIVLWYVSRWLLAIPEVQTLVNAFRSGSFNDDQVNAAIEAIRTHIAQLLGGSPARR